MSNFLDKDCHILDMHSEWVGDSEMRVRVRHFGKKNRIMVDVTELAPHHTSKIRAAKVATSAARKVGVPNVDFVTVSDFETVRVSYRIHSDNTKVRTKVRSMTFAFDGIE